MKIAEEGFLAEEEGFLAAEECFLPEEEEAYIYRLPDELLFLIFNKLVDARCLCMCYIVSKRFSLIIPQIHSISLATFRRNTNSPNHQNHPEPEENFPRKLLNFLFKNVIARPFRYLQITAAPKPRHVKFDAASFRSSLEFLKKFKAIRNLQMQLPSFLSSDAVLKWHAEFDDVLNFCVILFADSFRETRTEESESEAETDSFPLTNELLRSRVDLAIQVVTEAAWRLHMLRHLAQYHRMLERAAITDSENKGKILLRENQLVDLRDKQPILLSSGYVQVWYVPILRLPLLGYVMEGATLLALRATDQTFVDDGSTLSNLMEGAFDSEEAVFKEAVAQICDNPLTTFAMDLNLTT